MPTTASRASPTSGSGRPVRLGAACTVGSSGGSAMRRCGALGVAAGLLARVDARASRLRGRAGAGGGGAAGRAGAALAALPGCRCATARSAPAGPGRCGGRASPACRAPAGCRVRAGVVAGVVGALSPSAWSGVVPARPAVVVARRRRGLRFGLGRRRAFAPRSCFALPWCSRLLRRGLRPADRLGAAAGPASRPAARRRHDRLGADERGGAALGPLARRAGGAGGQGSLTCGHQ